MIRKSGLITHKHDTIIVIQNGNAGCMASVSTSLLVICKALSRKSSTKILLHSYSIAINILSSRLKSI